MLTNRHIVMGVSASVIATVALIWFFMPQAGLRIVPTHTLTVGETEIAIAIADTPALRAQGLSGTSMLGSDEGMLFVFENDGQHAFWMKDMQYAIDIIWIDAGRSVVHVEHAVTPESFPRSFMPDTPARYVLEVPAGFATEHGIGVGSKLHDLPIDSL